MIQIKNVVFRYSRKKQLFENLELEMQPGLIYGLLGKNGAGKSTLLKLITGMAFPDGGSIKVRGIEPSKRDPEMLQEIYLVPEEFELPQVKISTYIKINSPFYPKFNREQFAKYMEEFELTDDAKVSNLSYGQKKKFLIAFGLATNAQLLILDEPTNGLDIPSKSQFRKTVAGAMDEDRMIVISTHQVRDLENLLDNIVVLEKGKVIFNHSLADISQKLQFEHNISQVPANEVIYVEELSGKKAGIIKNRSGMDSRVDMELLFNSIIKSPEIINQHLKTQENVSI